MSSIRISFHLLACRNIKYKVDGLPATSLPRLATYNSGRPPHSTHSLSTPATCPISQRQHIGKSTCNHISAHVQRTTQISQHLGLRLPGAARPSSFSSRWVSASLSSPRSLRHNHVVAREAVSGSDEADVQKKSKARQDKCVTVSRNVRASLQQEHLGRDPRSKEQVVTKP